MKRVLVILAMLAGIAQAETNLLFVSRVVDTNRYFVPVHGKTTPEEFNSNCVLYLNANSPVVDEGTTSAEWLDFSPEYNDTTQTSTDKQPDRVFTNGAWAWEFDRVDDCLYIPGDLTSVFLSTNQTLLVELDIISTEPHQVIAGRNKAVSTADRTFGLVKYYNSIRLVSENANGDQVSSISTVPSGFFTVVGTYDGLFQRLYIDGVLADSDAQSGALADYPGAKNTIGVGQAYSMKYHFLGGDIRRLMIFDRALTSNEVWRLSQ